MQDWLNRLGLTLQFLALFLVTPTIVGEDLMLKVGKSLSDSAHRWAVKMEARRKKISDKPVSLGLVLTVFALPQIIGAILYNGWHTGTAHSVGHGIIQVHLSFLLVVCAITIAAVSVPRAMSGLSWLIRIGTRSAHALLLMGAILFTIGFAVLLAATWIHL
jgi:hypothetical protein